jgi:hypothetical protein
MQLARYLEIIRRRWQLVLVLPLLAALASLVAGLTQPPRFAATAQLLVTRSEDRRFDTEDALAYDLPAIVSGEPFARSVSVALAQQGQQLSPDEARAVLSAANSRRVVTIRATHSEPAIAAAALDAAIDLVQREGLRLWGDPAATEANPGVNVVVLAGLPPRAEQINGIRALALDAAARAAVGLVAAVGLTFGLHALERGRSANNANEREFGSSSHSIRED